MRANAFSSTIPFVECPWVARIIGFGPSIISNRPFSQAVTWIKTKQTARSFNQIRWSDTEFSAHSQKQ